MLDNAVTTANQSAFKVKRLICQVGSTAVQALTLGTAYPITVVVNGVSSNANDQFGNALTFTPISAPTIFVSENGSGTGSDTNPGAGSDAAAGTIAAPKQHIQTYAGSNMLGVMASNTSVTSGSSNGVQAGTQVVLRGGTYTSTTTHADRFCEYFRVTGCPASATPSGGSKGVNAGYIKVTAYPGPILANACEVPFISNTGAGGFMGSDSARATGTVESVPYGLNGFGKYIAHSNLKITVSSSQTNSSAGPIYCNNGSDFWRNVNNDLSFPNANHMLSAGISAGNGLNQMHIGNRIDNVQCDSGLQNHGIYCDGGVIFNAGSTIAYNLITNITGGSGWQCFNQAVTPPDFNGNSGFVGLVVAYNWIDTCAKYGINFADFSIGVKAYDNVILNCSLYSVRFNTTESNLAISVMNNTCYNADPTGVSLNAMVTNEWNATSGYVEILDNVFVMGAARSNATLAFYNNNANDANFIWGNNLYFDPQGHTTAAPTGGTRSGEIYGDPKWTTNYIDFRLQATSPALNAGATSTHLAPTTDFALNTVSTMTPSIGAFGTPQPTPDNPPFGFEVPTSSWVDSAISRQRRVGIAALIPAPVAMVPPPRALAPAAADVWAPPQQRPQIAAFFSGPVPSPLPPPARVQISTWPTDPPVTQPKPGSAQLFAPPPTPDNPPPLRRQQPIQVVEIGVMQPEPLLAAILAPPAPSAPPPLVRAQVAAWPADIGPIQSRSIAAAISAPDAPPLTGSRSVVMVWPAPYVASQQRPGIAALLTAAPAADIPPPLRRQAPPMVDEQPPVRLQFFVAAILATEPTPVERTDLTPRRAFPARAPRNAPPARHPRHPSGGRPPRTS